MPEIDRDKIIQLRKLGKTYQEIKDELGVPKSALSRLLSGQDFSKMISQVNNDRLKEWRRIKLASINKFRKGSAALLFEEAREDARDEFEVFKFHPLFIAGLTIFDAHGAKASKNACTISSGDHEVIRIGLRFFNDICGIPLSALNVRILLPEGVLVDDALNFWSQNTQIPVVNFRKSSIIKGRSRKKGAFYGVCTVGLFNRYLKEKILIWLVLMRQQLLSGAYYQEILFPKK